MIWKRLTLPFSKAECQLLQFATQQDCTPREKKGWAWWGVACLSSKLLRQAPATKGKIMTGVALKKCISCAGLLRPECIQLWPGAECLVQWW